MTDELFTRRVLREVSRAGKPITCAAITIELGEWACDVRYALHLLVESGDVRDVGGLYERANNNFPEDAA